MFNCFRTFVRIFLKFFDFNLSWFQCSNVDVVILQGLKKFNIHLHLWFFIGHFVDIVGRLVKNLRQISKSIYKISESETFSQVFVLVISGFIDTFNQHIQCKLWLFF